MPTSYVGKRDWKNMLDGARRHHKRRLHKQVRNESRNVAETQLANWQEDKATDAMWEEFHWQMEEAARMDAELYGN